MEPTKYNKKSGAAGVKGTDYQIKLLELFLLQGFYNNDYFNLSTENEDAGNFDDIVYETNERIILLQAKSKEKSISFNHLFSKTSEEKGEEKGDFNLYKYVKTLTKIIKKFEVKKIEYLIICTNSKFNVKNINDCLNKEIENCDKIRKEYLLEKDEMVHKISSVSHNKCYFFQRDCLPSLVNYISKNVPVISEDIIKLFLEKLILVSIIDRDLDNRIEFLIKESSIIDKNIPQGLVQSYLFDKVKTWFKSDKGTYLTKFNAIEYLYQIGVQNYITKKISNLSLLNGEYTEKLEKDNYPTNLNENVILLEIETKETLDLHEFKIYQFLLNNLMFADMLKEKKESIMEKILFVNPNSSDEIMKIVITSFQMPQYVYLVVPIFEFQTFSQIEGELNNTILKMKRYKKIIIISDNTNIKQNIPNIRNFKVDIKICDFSKEIQNEILMETINYQGNKMPVEKIINKQIIETVLDELTLLKLIRGESNNIVVNKNVKEYEEVIGYVKRIFISQNEQYGETEFCSKILEESDYKFIGIIDFAGMGKSTVLDRLDYLLRSKPHWIIKINLNEFTGILYKLSKQNCECMTLEELLTFFKFSKKMKLETNIFNIHQNVILLLDALDEISPEYTNLILNTLSSISLNNNIRKIVITSRPHILNKLKEKKIQLENYALESFSDEDSIILLSQSWWKQLDKLNNENTYIIIKKFTKNLIDNLYKTVGWKNIKTLIGIPLQTKMLADIFINHCKNYLENVENLIILPADFNISWLYEQFIKRKRDIYIEEKCNADGNVATMESLEKSFSNAIDDHIKIALKLEFPEGKHFFRILSTPDGCDEKTLLKIGIMNKIDQNIQFVHRTFSEYLAATHVCDLILKNETSEQFLLYLIPQELIRTPFIISLLMNHSIPYVIIDKLLYFISSLDQNVLLYAEISEWVMDLIPKYGYEKLFTWESTILLERVHAAANYSYNLSDKFLEMLDKIQNIDICHENGTTPLHLACQYNSVIVVEKLLDKGHTLVVRDKNGRTALHFAANRLTKVLVDFLLSRGHPINVNDINGITPLHDAASNHNHSMVSLLLKNNHLVNVVDSNGKSPLHYAVDEIYTETIVISLLNHDSLVDNADKDGKTALHYAAARNSPENVANLLQKQHSANMADANGKTPLHYAVQYGHLENVKILLNTGHSIDVKDNDGKTLLHYAFEYKDLVKMLVDRGHSINVCNNNGSTVLHYAAEYDKIDTINFLLDNNHPVNVVDKSGITPLHLAARHGFTRTVKLLIDEGHQINVKDVLGKGPLHYAVANFCSDTVYFLLNNGHPVNVRDAEGSTPLHDLIQSINYCSFNEAHIIKMLLAHGQVNVMNKKGETPISLAKKRKLPQVVNLLKLSIKNPNLGTKLLTFVDYVTRLLFM